MTAIDWEQIIGKGVNESFWRMGGGGGPSQAETNTGDLQVAHDVLATRVPQACPTCEGDGNRRSECGAYRPGACPDCPTVAKLLAIGAAVMGFDELPQSSDAYSDGWNDCLIALRAVEP
jgi:hypothetical protein